MIEIGVELESGEVYEAGATLLAVLAWPECLMDQAAMDARHAALCRIYLQARAEIEPTWAATPQLIRPRYLTQPRKQVEQFDREMRRRLRDRMVAAKMMVPFLQKASGAIPLLPKATRRPTVEAMARLAQADSGQGDIPNLKARVWRPSLPVIHIAAAVAVAVHLGEGTDQEVHVARLLSDPSLIAGSCRHPRNMPGCWRRPIGPRSLPTNWSSSASLKLVHFFAQQMNQTGRAGSASVGACIARTAKHPGPPKSLAVLARSAPDDPRAMHPHVA